MNIRYSFENRCALVTGGAQGIGFEIAKSFLTAGAFVTIADYSDEALETAKNELRNFENLQTIKVDVTDRESCAEMAKALKKPINFLINNAGITRDKTFARMADADFDAVISTNLTGLYNVTKAVLTSFEAKAPNRIINMSSVVALYGNVGQTNYVAAKAGVIGLTKTWARELTRKGITTNAIAPGFIRTKMTAAMPPDILAGWEDKVPVGRLGEPSDIANACMYLASEEAGYINGAVISVDGGVVL
jgi:3-oxoacyl-[acyl-carrier protein] reductase